MRRPISFLVLLAAGLTFGAGCGVASDDRASLEPAAAVPFDLLGTTPPGTTANSSAAGAVLTRVCLPAADDRVHPVVRSMAPGYRTIDLVDVLVAGPTEAERAFGLHTAIVEPGTVTAIEVEGGVAKVDLDPTLAARPTTNQLTVVTQLVCTLTEQPGVGQVRFTVDRQAIAVPRGDGSTTTDPVSRQDYEALIDPST